MPTPRQKVSKQKKRTRRAHHHLTVPAISSCARCNAIRRPHQVCASCGYYDGKPVIATESQLA